MLPRLSVIIPAFNEAHRIVPTLTRVHEYLQKQSYGWEIIVVVNNTNDATVQVVHTSGITNVRILDIGYTKSKSGTKGLAVKTGMLQAVGEYRLFMDADNATDISEIEKLWPAFEMDADVAFGSRYVHGAHTHRVWYRNVMGRLSNIVVQLFLLPGIQDTQCGFKCFTASAAEEIFSNMTLAGWGFDMEVLYSARKYSLTITEVPIVWNEIGRSSLKTNAFLTTLYDLIKIRKKKYS